MSLFVGLPAEMRCLPASILVFGSLSESVTSLPLSVGRAVGESAEVKMRFNRMRGHRDHIIPPLREDKNVPNSDAMDSFLPRFMGASIMVPLVLNESLISSTERGTSG